MYPGEACLTERYMVVAFKGKFLEGLAREKG
jgi:hypothetical protein